jgi:hypothetical protein
MNVDTIVSDIPVACRTYERPVYDEDGNQTGTTTEQCTYVWVAWSPQYGKRYIKQTDMDAQMLGPDPDAEDDPVVAVMAKITREGVIRCGAYGETIADLKEYAKKHAIRVTRSMALKWHNAGILRAPE